MYKIHHEAVPSVISGMFVKRFKIINRETRQSHNFNVPIVLSAHTKRTIYIIMVQYPLLSFVPAWN